MGKKEIYSKEGKMSFVQRVQHAVDCWQRYTSGMRKCRQRMFAHYANGWFNGGPGPASTYTAQPINLIDRGVSIIAPILVSRNPKVMVCPRQGANNPQMRPFAATLELAIAHLFDEIDLSTYTLRPLVIDALFGMGVTKTGVMHSHEVEIMGHLHDVGQPYCDKVDFEDYIGDISARNRQEVRLEGNWYRLPEEYVKTCGLFKHYDGLSPDTAQFGDDTRPEKVAKPDGSTGEYYELKPTVELADVWLPDEGVVITIPRKGCGDRIMRTVEWDGPEGGPYDVLVFRPFPDSIVGIPVTYTWLDLNKTVNNVVVKMRDQAIREKSIGLYNLGNAEDAGNIKTARDGELVGVMDTDSIKELRYGGFNEQSFAFVNFLLHQWSQTGPNLDTIGGRRVDAPTLGQEQMMQSNAARELDDMIHQTYKVTKSIARKLTWFLWTDPMIILPLIKRVAGIDIEVEYSDAAKEGDFFDYSFDIEPYSMMRMNPEMRYQRLMQFVQGYILPTAQIAAAQGTMLNVPELAKDFARYLGISNLEDWYQSIIPQTQLGMNPYSPMQGQVAGGGQTDGRFQSDSGSNFNNANRQQSSAGGQSTGSPLGATTQGM